MYIPRITNYEKFIYSDKSRVDLNIPLELDKIGLISSLLNINHMERSYTAFYNAARFYWRALHNMENEPELAFIDLVSCGEALSGGFDFKTDDLISHDAELRNIINIIKNGNINNTDKTKICLFMRKRLYQVRRKYVLTISNSLNDYFFSNNETSCDTTMCSISSENIDKCIKRTYDLRSKYVHEGLYLGDKIKELTNYDNEIAITLNDDKNMINTLTLHGLERIMRYCLLVYIHNYLGINIDDRLKVDNDVLTIASK